VATPETDFDVMAETLSAEQLLRLRVPNFEKLSLRQKQLVYYLSEAALCGRDITYDQKDKNGLTIRKTLENMHSTYQGDRHTPEWRQFEDYCGRFFFHSGNHHFYSSDKFIPNCSFDYFSEVATGANPNGFPLKKGESLDDFLKRIQPIVFDPNLNPKMVDLRPDGDNVQNSSINFYEGVTAKEAIEFYGKFKSAATSPSWGLNSKLIKGPDGLIREQTWRVGGMYSPALEKMVSWLEKAQEVAENPAQRESLGKLIEFYRTGDLHTLDEYWISWVKNKNSSVEWVMGFVECYNDPLGRKGTFEGHVAFRDPEATRRIALIASYAQWFEDNSPILPEHKKKEVRGILAHALNVVVASGDISPAIPIGINQPNAAWIKEAHGSKSASLSNVIHGYNSGKLVNGGTSEFAYGTEQITLSTKYGSLAADLLTALHECIGHASGQLNHGVETPEKTLRQYALTLEEARADLVALYFACDPKLVELGVIPDLDVSKALYNSYITNGLISQLAQIEPGDDLEEAHMRNRQLICKWVYERGVKDNVIEYVKKDNKTYAVINDYDKLRDLFGNLLREVQRIKSEGDFDAGQALVEGYGVTVDQTLLQEVRERDALSGMKPHSGLINPELREIRDQKGEVIDIQLVYPPSFLEQMIDYGTKYSHLPVEN
jgi:dipeptidyl-peptidase-3